MLKHIFNALILKNIINLHLIGELQRGFSTSFYALDENKAVRGKAKPPCLEGEEFFNLFST